MPEVYRPPKPGMIRVMIEFTSSGPMKNVACTSAGDTVWVVENMNARLLWYLPKIVSSSAMTSTPPMCQYTLKSLSRAVNLMPITLMSTWGIMMMIITNSQKFQPFTAPRIGTVASPGTLKSSVNKPVMYIAAAMLMPAVMEIWPSMLSQAVTQAQV